MAIIASGTPQWMLLLEGIRHIQTKLGASIDDAAAAILVMLQRGAVPGRRCGLESSVPLDGQFESWNGTFTLLAWRWATIHDDGTVSFDTSLGHPLLRRARQHEIDVRHMVEIERSALLRCWPDAAPSRQRERPYWPEAREIALEWLRENGAPVPGAGEQAKLERHVTDWLAQKRKEHPVPSTVRNHVQQWIREYCASYSAQQ
jgi:hypothetical protein